MTALAAPAGDHGTSYQVMFNSTAAPAGGQPWCMFDSTAAPAGGRPWCMFDSTAAPAGDHGASSPAELILLNCLTMDWNRTHKSLLFF